MRTLAAIAPSAFGQFIECPKRAGGYQCKHGERPDRKAHFRRRRRRICRSIRVSKPPEKPARVSRESVPPSSPDVRTTALEWPIPAVLKASTVDDIMSGFARVDYVVPVAGDPYCDQHSTDRGSCPLRSSADLCVRLHAQSIGGRGFNMDGCFEASAARFGRFGAETFFLLSTSYATPRRRRFTRGNIPVAPLRGHKVRGRTWKQNRCLYSRRSRFGDPYRRAHAAHARGTSAAMPRAFSIGRGGVHFASITSATFAALKSMCITIGTPILLVFSNATPSPSDSIMIGTRPYHVWIAPGP